MKSIAITLMLLLASNAYGAVLTQRDVVPHMGTMLLTTETPKRKTPIKRNRRFWRIARNLYRRGLI